MATLEEKKVEKSKFIINCHEMYDRIHGSQIVINIFDPIFLFRNIHFVMQMQLVFKINDLL